MEVVYEACVGMMGHFVLWLPGAERPANEGGGSFRERISGFVPITALLIVII